MHTSITEGGFPFTIKQPRFNAETPAAMQEARRISRDPDAPSYSSIEELKKALLSD
ncbi:toxin-antitoxin system, antitoxin component, ribbon-helix-helix domain protein [Amygdalobacter nucleatus]|uniref:Toxin-antitoxin system, antitoxin component, ribbon-helix-helix domain protein n=1 Tax=Amygdalobacter nucleatus TaxID=3029274 RepID=A0A133YG49_9FIRM|nr:toxin-antitoxin system, antitoxin component, ribbon-helix-helix domain protein [Amygdalobacter nucleatus]